MWSAAEYSSCLGMWWWTARCRSDGQSLCKAGDQTAEAGPRGQSGRHESLLLHCTVERPITLPESSTWFKKCFALKVKSLSAATASSKWLQHDCRLEQTLIHSQSQYVRWPAGTKCLHKDWMQSSGMLMIQEFWFGCLKRRLHKSWQAQLMRTLSNHDIFWQLISCAAVV